MYKYDNMSYNAVKHIKKKIFNIEIYWYMQCVCRHCVSRHHQYQSNLTIKQEKNTGLAALVNLISHYNGFLGNN